MVSNFFKKLYETKKFKIIQKQEFENTRYYYQIANNFAYSILKKYNYIFENKDYNYEDENYILDSINKGNYPSELELFAKMLLEAAGPNNLGLCTKNLLTSKIEHIDSKMINTLSILYGCYKIKENKIVYFDDKTLAHEFLHLASTFYDGNEISYVTGFEYCNQNLLFQEGLNEGYTEMLARKTFYGNDYTGCAYKLNVYIARLFELLYDYPYDMLSDYLHANYQSPYIQFIKYGTDEDFIKINKYLDFIAATDIIEKEDFEVLRLLNKAIRKTNDTDKIIKANFITKEYVESLPKKEKKLTFFKR